MGKAITLMTGTSGVNNRVDPKRLKFDPETGIVELAEGLNVTIDDTGRPGRRKGYTLKFPGSYHSMYVYNDHCYCVGGDTLYELNPDYSLRVLGSGLIPDLFMSFVGIGTEVFHANGVHNGVIDQETGLVKPWVGNPYVGPPIKFQVTTKAPVGHLLDVMGGYLLLAIDRFILFSMPFAPYWFLPQKNAVQFTSKITMMRAVEDGVWVSDQRAIYFLSGSDPNKWEQLDKAPYPAIFGTVADAEISKVGALAAKAAGAMSFTSKGAGNIGLMWATPRGICAGNGNGTFLNLTEAKLVLPSAIQGAGHWHDGQYIVSLRP